LAFEYDKRKVKGNHEGMQMKETRADDVNVFGKQLILQKQ